MLVLAFLTTEPTGLKGLHSHRSRVIEFWTQNQKTDSVCEISQKFNFKPVFLFVE